MTKNYGEVLTRDQLLARRKNVKRGDDGKPLIVIPDESDIARAKMANRLCMFCQCWNLKAGQDEIGRQDFWHRILRDEKYQQEWFENQNEYGMCEHFPERLIPAVCPAVIMKSDLDSSLYGKPEGMHKVECPMFRDRRKHGAKMSISRSHIRELER